MDYKNTVNLPRTDFPMKADLVTREPQRLARWQQENLYARIEAGRADAPRFVLHDGPPFANGDVHVGTALNKTLKDIIIKYKNLRGFHAPYVPGWDCHGLPIEFKVTQDMRKEFEANRKTKYQDAQNEDLDKTIELNRQLSPEVVRTACDAYARNFINIQREQFKRLGVFGDWENPYLTLNKEYEADELRMFADIVDKGFVYRGKKPVYWSIPCRTALAEAEVEYQDHVSQSVYVKFPIVGETGLFVLIWTTTPWTLPANLAVAYNSKLNYNVIRVGNERYLINDTLAGAVAVKCGWEGFEIVRAVEPEDLAKFQYHHPFCNRTGRFLAGDEFVENSTGTGFVHIAPGHGLEDYGLGRRNGLPVYSPVDDDGCLTTTNDLPREQQMPDELVGKSILSKHGRSDANDAVLHLLRVRNVLLHQENYHHSYPHCWRSKTPVVFRAMDQWFIRIDNVVDGEFFRLKAIREIDRVQWIPEWGVNRIKGAVESRPDWCISRQRSWGVPIPAFYDAAGEAILDGRVVRNVAALIEQHGSNVWFEKSAADLWSLVKPSDWVGGEAVAKSVDTLDVWIDSGSSSRAVLMRRQELHSKPETSNPKLNWQADVYLEGSDQHRGWFQSSLLLSLAGNGAAPFKTVLTHGFMVDEDREKISKSKQGQGGYVKPQTADRYIKDWGADVIRLWVASQDYRNDIVVSEERLKKVSETYRLLRNTLRYQISNLYDFNPTKDSVTDDKLTGLDRWILAEFSKLEADVIKAYDTYEFHVVYQRVSQFAAVELSAIYHDIVKDRLYTDPANSARRRSTQTALYRIVSGLCRILSPILVFTADEAWEFIPFAPVKSVHMSEWKPSTVKLSDADQADWSELFALRERVLPALEKARQAKLIGKGLDAQVALATDKTPISRKPHLHDIFRELINVSALTVRPLEATGFEVEPDFVVEKADGQKCERCWHWEKDVAT
ncbi:MAG TPA: isoleucine--tRNA ligase, partial [Roseimicrobium sp.]|nr:isoleucine--tRNA ligase [Roseimicrobium sp.]